MTENGWSELDISNNILDTFLTTFFHQKLGRAIEEM